MPVAFYALYGQLSPVDDETFFLLPIRLVAHGQALYDDVFNSYGPVYFDVFVPLSHLLGGITHDRGRMIVLVLWIASSLLCGIGVRRITGSLAFGLVAMAVEFKLMSALAAEPMNPGALLNVLLMAMVVVAAGRATRRQAVALGGLGAAAALVKLNVGGYALVAALVALSVTAMDDRRARRAVLGAVLVLLPIAVFARDVGVRPAMELLALVVAAGVAVALTIDRLEFQALRPRGDVARCILGAAVLTFVGLAFAVAFLGSSVGGVLDGAFAEAVRVSGSFKLWRHITFVPAIAAVLLAALSGRIPDALRLAAGILVLVACLLPTFGLADFRPITWGLPLVWLAARDDPRGSAYNNRFARVFLTTLAVLEAMYAYPVAGSQVAFGAAPLAAVGAVCAADGLRFIGTVPWRVAAAVAAAACLWFGIGAAYEGQRDQYDRGVVLPYPGARQIHGDPAFVARMRWMVDHVRGCRQVITLPGLSGVYWFSGVDPPTFLPEVWMKLLPLRDQRKAIAALAGERRSCAIVDQWALQFWLRGAPLPSNPLTRYLQTNFRAYDSVRFYPHGPSGPGYTIFSLRKLAAAQ